MPPATISDFQYWFLRQTETPSLDQDKLGQDLIHLSQYWHSSPQFPWFHRRPVVPSCHDCFDFHSLCLWWSEDVSLETPQRMVHMNISCSFPGWRKPHDESMAIEPYKMFENKKKIHCFEEMECKFRECCVGSIIMPFFRSYEHNKGLILRAIRAYSVQVTSFRNTRFALQHIETNLILSSSKLFRILTVH